MRRLLIQNATVITMDRQQGDLRPGDVLIEGDRIAAVGPHIHAPDAEMIDGRAFILIPGLINAHMHTWQTGLRAVSANWTLLEYFRWVHAGLATRFQPEDIRVGTLAGALNQMNCGTTTLVDWCHNNPTPAHTDAGIEGLRESGIRGAFFHGSPKPDPKPGERHFSEIPHPRGEVERLMRGPFASRDQLLTLGLAILGPHFSTLEVSRARFSSGTRMRTCRFDASGRRRRQKHPADGMFSSAKVWSGDYVNIVHGNDLSDDRLKRFVGLGVTFSVTPENEMAQGHGHPITGRLRKLGAAPSLGVDLESVVSGDMLTVARMALEHQRALDNAECRAATGGIPATSTIPAREALSWITVEGARMLGMQDQLGSIATGKQADLVFIRADALNLWPVHDPVATVVMQANLANIDSVMIAGEWRKRDGKLLYADIDRVKTELVRSSQRILSALGWRSDSGRAEPVGQRLRLSKEEISK